jgi:hypothetical protein
MDEQKFEQAVGAIEDKVDNILAILRGNELDKDDKGMIGNVDALGKRVTKLEKWNDRTIWIMVGMAAPASWGTLEILHIVVKSLIQK